MNINSRIAVVEAYHRMKEYAYQVFDDPDVDGLDSGWAMIDDPDNPDDLGEVTIGFYIRGVRLEVRRIIHEGDEPDTCGQSIVGEMLIKKEELTKKGC